MLNPPIVELATNPKEVLLNEVFKYSTPATSGRIALSVEDSIKSPVVRAVFKFSAKKSGFNYEFVVNKAPYSLTLPTDAFGKQQTVELKQPRIEIQSFFRGVWHIIDIVPIKKTITADKDCEITLCWGNRSLIDVWE
jgi:hypothetical protein